ncbi:hypothetical protein [Sphingobacterium faecale]|uniref:Lipoprotein n=1 Tax=Sphingobacterium faecale TaxID=2803775 RepID=A0ABS1R8Z9_9SPHI|nr:hypothetical protein [Sphingobacterium faecale]MBL1410467.1 hypothetical protein [Sphingobacterium faecale]
MKKTKTTILAALAGVLLMTSCGDGGVYPQNEGGGKAVKQLIDKNFNGEKQVQELTIKAKEELYGELGTITVIYWDGDKQTEEVFSTADGVKGPQETFGSKHKMTNLPKTKTVAIKEFDVEPIPYKVGEAAGLIPEEYENYALADYEFTVGDDGKIKQRFTINTTKKGEGKTQNGRMVSQNYYPFKFKIDEGGKVVSID